LLNYLSIPYFNTDYLQYFLYKHVFIEYRFSGVYLAIFCLRNGAHYTSNGNALEEKDIHETEEILENEGVRKL